MELDIRKTPFSRFGSWFVLSLYEQCDDNGLFLRDIRGGDETEGKIFKIELLSKKGNPFDLSYSMRETALTVTPQKGEGKVRFCFPTENLVQIDSQGDFKVRLTLQLKKYDHINRLAPSLFELHSYSQEVKMRLTLQAGEVAPYLPWEAIGNSSGELTFSGDSELLIESYTVVPLSKRAECRSFEEGEAAASQSYTKWLSQMPESSSHFFHSKEVASYITWSSVVSPDGIMKKGAMYMSNNWMTNIWSWDNTFNALPLALGNPEMAWEQFTFFEEFQHESGIFPDFVNNCTASFACCKPPVQGVIYPLLERENSFFKEPSQLQQLYKSLVKLGGYWENYRNHSATGLYYYNHGNDSGWDNASVFDSGCPVVAPDLQGYLIALYDLLAEIGEALNLNDTKEWRKRGEQLQKRLVETLWDGSRFRSIDFYGNSVEGAESLIELMPLVIGYRLPKEVTEGMVNRLKGRFLTAWGAATEAPESRYYQQNGYWRGPIWAPVTLLLVVGLERAGYKKEAKELALNFCRLPERGGMAENFDPFSGEGLVDPAFTWTSSVFLYLSNQLLRGVYEE